MLTPHAAETWMAALGEYDAGVVKRAIVQVATSPDPFPDLGKLLLLCETMRRIESGTVAQGEVKIGTAMLAKIQRAWQI